MGHLLQFSHSQWQRAGEVWPRYREWVLFLYAIALTVLGRVMSHWWATDPLLLIATGVPVIFLARHYIGTTIGVLLTLAGSVWLVFLVVR
jgi:hypothetical protein